MKKHILTLFAVLSVIVAFGQSSLRSEMSFTVRESDTEYTIKATFPADRAGKLHSELNAVLGKPQTDEAPNRWSMPAYIAELSTEHFQASLDKEKATGGQLNLFKKLAEKLRAALDQPKTPKQP